MGGFFYFSCRILIMSSRQNGDSDYSNLDQTGNTLVGNSNEVDLQHTGTSIDNVGMPNLNISTAIPASII